jgi:hypothetical protein
MLSQTRCFKTDKYSLLICVGDAFLGKIIYLFTHYLDLFNGAFDVLDYIASNNIIIGKEWTGKNMKGIFYVIYFTALSVFQII